MTKTITKLLLALIIIINLTSTQIIAQKASSTMRYEHKVKAISLLRLENENVRAISSFELTEGMRELSTVMANDLNLPGYGQTKINNNIESDHSRHRHSNISKPVKKGLSFSDVASKVQRKPSSTNSNSRKNNKDSLALVFSK
jgi:hypothetical protein